MLEFLLHQTVHLTVVQSCHDMKQEFIFLQQVCPMPDQAPSLEAGLDRILSLAESIAAAPRPSRPAPFSPEGWQSVPVAQGVTAYVPLAEETITIEPELPGFYAGSAAGSDSSSDRPLQGQSLQGNSWDGTRHPYQSEIRSGDLLANQVAPGVYIWEDTWQGEGYDRRLSQSGELVSDREGGADIYISMAYHANLTDPKQPNLVITVESNQDRTAQLTNLSAFRFDPQTGDILERRDFEQLEPFYEVILTKNGGFAGTETKYLEPLGVVTFAFHVTPEELKRSFPLRLEGINRLFNQRQQELYELEAKGWVVKEVPPPG